ncbi:hypothetical protein [Kitasatospora sp. NPDC059571]|uniref:hypothetical protein n=1 Tax=Kitasatospora sp. NPDC059571 TaxID=3346871 RepID=UPI003693B914
MGRLPALEAGERAALVAVCALAVGACRSDTADLTAFIDRAVAAGRAAAPDYE